MPVKAAGSCGLEAGQEVPVVASRGRHRTDDRGESIRCAWGGHTMCWQRIHHLADFPHKTGSIHGKYVTSGIFISSDWSRLRQIWSLSSFPPDFNFYDRFSGAYKKPKHLIHEILNASDKRDISSWAGMSGSVYVTQLTTMRAVSLNDRRKSCTFMSFLDKGRWGGEKCFLIRARESNSPHALCVPETTGNYPKKKTYPRHGP